MNTTVHKTASQPPLSHFDKSFTDNPWDSLYCALNDIEPIFADEDFTKAPPYLQAQTLDPRNKLAISQSIYDHTIYLKPEIFRCPNRSTLNYKEHSLCLSFLQSLKAKQQVFPHQVECFEKTFPRRKKEQNDFMNFLAQYNTASFEKIYAPNLLFAELYSKFYRHEVELLMAKHKDGIFQIHTGFPIPQKCGNVDKSGTISDIEFLDGCHSSFYRLDPNLDLSRMKSRIQTYFDLSLGEPKEINESEPDQQAQFNISTEALVFLLSAGEYIDNPTEVIVQVVPGEDGENVIHINDLLPSRNTGPHTAELVTSMCTDVFLKMKNEECATEIQATDFKGPYQLQTLDEFMSTQREHSSSSQSRSFGHVKWNLNLENDTKQFQIISKTKYAPKDTQKTRQTLHSIKLEYKTQFGCEIISKANLIREWFHLQFSNSPESPFSRLRINASTFKTVLQENLHLEEIELELERRYKVRIPRLLGSLGDFLGLLSNVGPGRYLLRYNSRFQDKLMLYSEVTASTSKSSVSVHSLLQETSSDLAFMTLRQLTPIDDVLCTAMHDFYKILPCSFPAGYSTSKTTRRIIDDRSYIQKKARIKQEIQEAKDRMAKKRRNFVKKTKRAQKLKQKSKAKQEDQKETQELEDEIKNDRILFGFE
ncbi:little elongation complex subunit 2 [Episyrphus balteatus]|uniref:little elongation complex subunit 2 n=1 Tax=Episyrphus balteatus TaxID=286459 RepID=UPI002485308D|nr:little elongation complex subunit 2 [Episyrphus balteatus]